MAKQNLLHSDTGRNDFFHNKKVPVNFSLHWFFLRVLGSLSVAVNITFVQAWFVHTMWAFYLLFPYALSISKKLRSAVPLCSMYFHEAQVSCSLALYVFPPGSGQQFPALYVFCTRLRSAVLLRSTLSQKFVEIFFGNFNSIEFHFKTNYLSLKSHFNDW